MKASIRLNEQKPAPQGRRIRSVCVCSSFDCVLGCSSFDCASNHGFAFRHLVKIRLGSAIRTFSLDIKERTLLRLKRAPFAFLLKFRMLIKKPVCIIIVILTQASIQTSAVQDPGFDSPFQSNPQADAVKTRMK